MLSVSGIVSTTMFGLLNINKPLTPASNPLESLVVATLSTVDTPHQ